MKILRSRKRIIVMFITLFVVVGCFFALPKEVNATENSQIDNPGLVFIGEKIKGNSGFNKNIFYLSETQLEKVKDNRNVEGLDIGNSYFKDKIYSSFENHGTGTYHYSRVEGLDVSTMLDAVVNGGTNAVNNYFVIAADGYSQNTTMSSISHLKYYGPGDTVGVESDKPIIALYKTSNEADEKDAGVVPTTSERLGKNKNVFMFGQTAVQESNNCKFLKSANVIVVNNAPLCIKSRSRSQSENASISSLIQEGRYKSQYTYIKENNNITYNVEGTPLQTAVDQLNLSTLMPDNTNYKLQIESEDGSTKNISKADISKSFLAWGFTDDKETPENQKGDYMICMPGTTEETAIAYNVSKINVVSQHGQIVTSKPGTVLAPVKLKASSGGCTSVNLRWSKVSGVEGYLISRYDKSSKKYKVIKTISRGATTSFSDKRLSFNKKYSYRVQGYKTIFGDENISAYSTVASATPTLGKGKVIKLTKSGKTKIKAKWSKISGSNGYQIVYGTNEKISKGRKIITIKSGKSTSGTIKNLKKGKRYYVKVCAYKTVKNKKIYGAYSKVKAIKR